VTGLFYLCGTGGKKKPKLGALDHQEKQWNVNATIQMLQPFVVCVSEYYGLFFTELVIPGMVYLEMPQNNLIPQLYDHNNLTKTFQGGSLSFFYAEVCVYHNPVFPRKWFVHAGPILWPHYCPDMTLLEL